MKRILTYLSLSLIMILAISPMRAKAQISMSYADTILGDTPFVYYRLDESSVTDTVEDEMGAHDGFFRNSPTVGVTGALVTDSVSTAVCFDRALSQYIELTTLGDFGSRLPDGFTVEYWLRSRDPINYQVIMGTANPGPYTILLVDVAKHNPEELRLYFRDDELRGYEASFYPTGDNIDIYDDSWHHIVHVYDPLASLLADRVIYYVDGERQTIEVRTNEVPYDSSDFDNPMTLGALNLRGSIEYYLNGCLDEVAFYTRPLSEEEVISHFEATVPDVYGCIKFQGEALAGVEVKLKQKKEKAQIATTNSEGCYYFETINSEKDYTVNTDCEIRGD